jgi:hypothetical protein
VPEEQSWLAETPLTLYEFQGDPRNFLPYVARWRRGTGPNVPSFRVDLHYVLTGEKYTVPRGGPAGPPWLANAHEPLTSWGVGAPVVAILDTGLDPLSAAAQLVDDGQGGVALAVEFDPQRDADILGEHPPVPGITTQLLSEAGHGTFIASMIARFAGGGVRMASIRVLDPDGVGTEKSIVEGLQRLRLELPTVHGSVVKVVNLSLGGFTDDGGWIEDEAERDELYPPELRDRAPSALAAELDLWSDEVLRDTVMVAAAGNDGLERKFWPAALAGSPPRVDRPLIVAVASLGSGLQASSFTNTGDWVTASTLGEDIIGDHPAGVVRLSANASETFDGELAARWSGTSFAAPLIAAAIARIAQHPSVPPFTVANTPFPRSGRTAWGLLEPTISAQPAAQAGLGGIWDPRANTPHLDPTVWG